MISLHCIILALVSTDKYVTSQPNVYFMNIKTEQIIEQKVYNTSTFYLFQMHMLCVLFIHTHINTLFYTLIPMHI